MEQSLQRIITGYQTFRKKYALGKSALMKDLAIQGQNPQIMLVGCCDSRVDPSLIFQCHPGDIFTVRNIANIIPPFEGDEKHHGTSASLEFGVCYLEVKHLIVLGHSQCGGLNALINQDTLKQNDFISHWLSILEEDLPASKNPDELGKAALIRAYDSCLTFPWIQKRVEAKTLQIHQWFFEVKTGEIFRYCREKNAYFPLA